MTKLIGLLALSSLALASLRPRQACTATVTETVTVSVCPSRKILPLTLHPPT